MTEIKITGAQVRMARAALRWSLAELAKRAGVGISTVQAIEGADDPAGVDAGGLETTRDYRAGARAESLGAITAALGKAGVTFLPNDGSGAGVRHKPKGKAK
jgi:transcriptional regulator with XRE-family HTH domain